MSILSGLALAVGIGATQYTDTATPEHHYRLEVTKEDTPFYIHATYEDMKVRMLGQPIGDTKIFTSGLGIRQKMTDGFFWHFELGFAYLDEGERDVIRQEVVYTELVGRHNVEFRPIPVYPENDYDQDSYVAVWQVDNGWSGALGVGYEFNPHVSVSLNYRILNLKEHIEIYDEEQRANGGGWWQETRSRDLNAWQFNVMYKF